MNRICIYSIYIGKLPDISRVWIKSCGYNKDFDFVLITDDKVENITIPPNLKIINYTLTEFKNKCQKAFNFPIELSNSYKLCDYRVVIGDVFKEELKKYEWWGFCDIDLIFGDLKKYITDEMLNLYQRIGMYGHLTLFKNCKEMNELYKKDGSIFNYKEVFSNKHNYIFDETAGLNMICRKNKIEWFKKLKIIDANRFSNRITEYFQENHFQEIFYWDNGKVKYAAIVDGKIIEDEFAYIHISSKKIEVPYDIDNIQSFYITSKQLYEKVKYDKLYDEIMEHTEFISERQDKEDNLKLRKIWLKKKKSLTFHEKLIQLKVYYALFIERYIARR